jgi:hypothetical protein
MKFLSAALLCLALPFGGMAQTNNAINVKGVTLARADSALFQLSVVEGRVYDINALQRGIDVAVIVLDQDGKKLREFDSPNGANGPERFDFTAKDTGPFSLIVKALDDPQNATSGLFDLTVRAYTDEEVAEREAEIARKAALVAKAKTIETADLDRFYAMFDKFKTAKTSKDSLALIQKLYFDQASGGMAEALDRVKLTPERYLQMISSHPRFFESMRANILAAKKSVPEVEAAMKRYKELYKAFIPFKVVYIVGPLMSGGADVFTTDNFVVVLCETVCFTDKVDASELNEEQKSFYTRHNNINRQILERVGHEATHFQMKGRNYMFDPNCPLLDNAIIEGICDWMSEKVTKGPVDLRRAAYAYGKKNPKELWTRFEAEMCNPKVVFSDWLFNKPKNGLPDNLGFAAAYLVINAYYEKQTDKVAALQHIMAVTAPKTFLEESGMGRN